SMEFFIEMVNYAAMKASKVYNRTYGYFSVAAGSFIQEQTMSN
ncbi:10974_t:CDS:2, partial [Gigaspora margarita]